MRSSLMALSVALLAPIVAAAPVEPGQHVVAGAFHTCARTEAGTVRCWGQNDSGQLGTGDLQERRTPVEVRGLRRVVQLAAGSQHTCARHEDGTVSCWGLNASGQAGHEVSSYVLRPAQVPGITGAVSIAAGDVSSCAVLKDGSVRCWGITPQAQILDSQHPAHAEPRPEADLASVAQLALGFDHACALKTDRSVWCWGSNVNGNLGAGDMKPNAQPRRVADDVISIGAGSQYTCALRRSGQVSCWGSAMQGQLGAAMKETHSATPRLVPSIHEATALMVGPAHACALLRGGDALCWGDNRYGQLGETGKKTPGAPVTVPAAKGASELALGGSIAVYGAAHTCAWFGDGDIRCWGSNANGQLGDGTTNASRAAVKVAWGAAPTVVTPRRGWAVTAREKPAAWTGPRTCNLPPNLVFPPGCGAGACGNGHRDVCGSNCAPCMPGHSCPCADIQESCDGQDLGGATCESVGFAGGTLRCASNCEHDTSGCYACDRTARLERCETLDLGVAERPMGLAIGATPTEAGIAWRSVCGGERFTRVGLDGALLSVSPPFGPAEPSSVRVLPLASGWLVALGSISGTELFRVSADGGKVTSIATFGALQLAFLIPRTGRGPLLGVTGTNWALLAAPLRRDGAPDGEPVPVLDPVTYEPEAASAVDVGDGVLVARAQQVPGRNRALVMTRLEYDGRTSTPFLAAGEEVNGAFVVRTSGGAAALYGAGKKPGVQGWRWVKLDGRGKPVAPPAWLELLTEERQKQDAALGYTTVAQVLPLEGGDALVELAFIRMGTGFPWRLELARVTPGGTLAVPPFPVTHGEEPFLSHGLALRGDTAVVAWLGGHFGRGVPRLGAASLAVKP